MAMKFKNEAQYTNNEKNEIFSKYTIAEHELAMYGKTNKMCPMCGKQILIKWIGNSYTIKCAGECLEYSVRGL